MKRNLRRKINGTGLELCEVCNQQNYLVQHHIQGRKIRNANHFSNLANICSNCHFKIHHGVIILESRIFTTAGYKLIWHYKDEESLTGTDATVHLL